MLRVRAHFSRTLILPSQWSVDNHSGGGYGRDHGRPCHHHLLLQVVYIHTILSSILTGKNAVISTAFSPRLHRRSGAALRHHRVHLRFLGLPISRKMKMLLITKETNYEFRTKKFSLHSMKRVRKYFQKFYFLNKKKIIHLQRYSAKLLHL